MNKITYIDEAEITNKRVLLRADFDVALNDDGTIADDIRIRHKLPTMKLLLKNQNKLICVSKLGRPEGRDPKFSIKVVANRLKHYFPELTVRVIDDFLTEDKKTFEQQTATEILLLENIRFYPQEEKNDPAFAKELASLADVYVNDAFAICHREEASLVGVPKLLPSYGGLELKTEITMLTKVRENPQNPFVAIMGGAKISTKLTLINKLIELADFIILGGGLANVFFKSKGYSIGSSICEDGMLQKAKDILALAKEKKTEIILPTDVVVGDYKHAEMKGKTLNIGEEIPSSLSILDIGPETQERFGEIIQQARTIIWNGPLGFFENPTYRKGTDATYTAITSNHEALSVVGGGDTLAAIANEPHLEKITHISTGGGAMLEFIEKGTLPAIEALKH